MLLFQTGFLLSAYKAGPTHEEETCYAVSRWDGREGCKRCGSCGSERAKCDEERGSPFLQGEGSLGTDGYEVGGG